jgi:hypothetical protein
MLIRAGERQSSRRMDRVGYLETCLLTLWTQSARGLCGGTGYKNVPVDGEGSWFVGSRGEGFERRVRVFSCWVSLSHICPRFYRFSLWPVAPNGGTGMKGS